LPQPVALNVKKDRDFTLCPFSLLFLFFVRFGLIFFDLLYEAIYQPKQANYAYDYAHGIGAHEEYCHRRGEDKDTKNHRRY
jgi:hypothetical protein